ncbi:uncharacterized protein [Pyxicephalus adspersus]|uniref:uncharacterized protein n=1 Tax=Pyxicephalus adspersus TaxID=30357 RepID=UPI003B5C7B7C
MEVQLMEYIRRTLTLDRNKDLIIEKLLNLTLEIIHLLTKEDFIVVRKSHDELKDGSGPSVPDRGSRAASPVAETTTHSGNEDSGCDQMDLQTGMTSQEKPQKVAIKSEVVPGLSLPEWDQSAVPIDKDIDIPQHPGSVGDNSERKMTESCRSAPYPQEDMIGDNGITTQDYEQYLYTEGYNVQINSQQLREEAWMYPQLCKQEESGHRTPGGCSERNVAEDCESAPYTQECAENENRIVIQDYQVEAEDGTIRCKEEAKPDHITAVRSEVEVKLYHCMECDECFTNHSDYSSHQRAHSTNHRFSCSICRVSFKSQSTFLRHHGCHLERPSSPSVAERNFVVRSTIVRYSGEKPFQCTECGRCFALKSTLVKHQRIHTGERPFTCRQCGRSFSQSCNLLRHKRRCVAAKMASSLS